MKHARWAWLLAGILALGAGAAFAAEEGAEQKLTTIEQMTREGKFESALVLADDLLKTDETQAAAHYLRGTLLEKLNRKDEALKAYDRCVVLLVGQQALAGELYRLLDRAKKAVFRLDPAKQLVMQAADELQKKSESLKGKDDEAQQRVLDLVELMRGDWSASPARQAGPQRLRKEVERRALDFFRSLSAGEVDRALELVDPQIRKSAGDDAVRKVLRPLSNAMRDAKIGAGDLKIRKVTLGEGRQGARVEPTYVLHERRDADAQYWVLRENVWYLGDEKSLRTFKPDASE